jgi:hypothetical protein
MEGIEQEEIHHNFGSLLKFFFIKDLLFVAHHATLGRFTTCTSTA